MFINAIISVSLKILDGIMAGLKFEVSKSAPKGNFTLKLDNTKKNINFYGSILSEFEYFRRFGSLPDNNIAVNRLINVFGSRLLDLEWDLKNDDVPTHRIKNHQLESLCNALTIDILCEIAPLEQERFKRPTCPTSFRIDEIFKRYITQLDSYPINPTIVSLKENLETQKNRLMQRLATYDDTQDTISNTELRAIYQQILYDFKDNQDLVSVSQNTFANTSVTEAFNDASTRELEAHVFSQDCPDDYQIYRIQDKEKISLSTQLMLSLNPENALKTFCLIESLENLSDESPKANIKLAYLKRQIREENIAAKTVLQMKLLTQEDQKNPKKTIISTIDELHQSIPSFDSNILSLVEQEVKNYSANDMFSALGFTCVSFGKYFEREMANKHPLLTAGFFLAASVTFGAAGLASLKVAPGLMNKILGTVSKAISLDGKIGVSQEQMRHYIMSTSEEWIKLCHAEESVLKTLVMNGFGLPKLTYLISDPLLNGTFNEDTITQLSKKMATSLEGKLPEEKIKEILGNIGLVAVILAATIGTGIGTHFLGQQAGAMHGIGEIIGAVTADFTPEFAAKIVTNPSIMSLVSLLVTAKSAGLIIAKIGLIVMHMNQPGPLTKTQKEELESQRNAVQMVGMLCEMNMQKPVNFDHWQSRNKLSDNIKQNFLLGYDKYPEVKEYFDNHQEWLESLGITLPQENYLFKILLAGLKAIFIGLPQFIGNKVLFPAIGIPLAIVGVIPAILSGKLNDFLKLAIINAGIKAISFLSIGIFMLPYQIFKVTVIALWESLKRTFMLIASMLIKTCLILYSLNDPLFGGKLLLANLSKIIIPILTFLPIQLYSIGGALYDLFFSSKEEGFFENRKNIFNVTFQGVNFWEKMEHDAISESGIVFYDYAKITTLNAIQIGFDWVTRLCGSFVLFVRNHTFRAIQYHTQRIDIENMCSDPCISSISEALPPVEKQDSDADVPYQRLFEGSPCKSSPSIDVSDESESKTENISVSSHK